LEDGFSLLPPLTAALVGAGVPFLPGDGGEAVPPLPLLRVKSPPGFFALLF